ncbi:unnamed protein product [Cuscuta campestris]|uniref:DUF4378 domain-containing protein n=1 Tax=Cuscuta campestris TaxID=132261 RepID=A0A484MF12_9ASTE|nr:unnamed protein product [Cuscuta campestris]
MAAKLLHSLTEDNPDLRKQIGCMTGIFQLFDRPQMISGGRRLVGNSPKRLISGSSHLNDETSEKEPSSNYHQRPTAAESNQTHKNVMEKQRFSTESSRPSFSSSSRSSSFSSLDCNRTAQPESAAFDRAVFPETPSRDPKNQLKTSQQYGRQILDIRDVVKESMNREALNMKATLREKVAESMVKLNKDSPTPLDLKESLRVLAKLREAPWHYGEPRQLSRSPSISKDAPRYSYDGKETRQLSFDSRDISKSILKQPPRLSLDGRESPTQSFHSDSKSSFSSKSSRQTPARPPSVVAKLMGLDTLPDSSNICQFDDPNPLSLSSEVTDQCHNHIQTSPSWRNPSSGLKPISRFPVEPAPWKQADKTQRCPEKLTSSNNIDAPAKLPSSFPSVYSEIENRLNDLEFTDSGKDLRALKQILEAMQAKGLLENQNVQEDSKLSGQNEQRIRGSNSLRSFESPIVIMKPAKLMEQSRIPFDSRGSSSCSSKGFRGRKGAVTMETSQTTKNQNLRAFQKVNAVNTLDSKTNSRCSKSTQASVRSKESTATSGSFKTPGPISPRLQQRRIDLEKRSKPPTPPSDPNRLRKQINKQAGESNSPGGRRRSKNSSIQQNDDRLSENEISIQSNGSVISDAKEDLEVTSSLASFEKSSIRSPMKYAEKRLSSVLCEDGSPAATAPPEYPSPVSVLDNLVYADESPLSGNRYKNPDRVSSTASCNPSDDHIWNETAYDVTPEFNRRKLQNIDNLVQKLRRLNSSHDEGRTDYIASLCENTNPDHRYVSEILLASGLLLRDIGSSITMFQFHQPGLPINPELFYVLEQTKSESITESKCDGKIHRKLVFGIVNEILASKLAFSSEPWSKKNPQKLAKGGLNAQKLLRELCMEIDHQFHAKPPKSDPEDGDGGLRNMAWEDVVHKSERWTDFTQEVSGIVLDIERLVFKDLVSELVRGEGDCSSVATKPSNSRRRQLFMK